MRFPVVNSFAIEQLQTGKTIVADTP